MPTTLQVGVTTRSPSQAQSFDYRQSCEAGAQEKLGSDAPTYCACTYDGFVRTVAFKDFKEFESDLRDNIGSGGNDINDRGDLEQRYGPITAMLDTCTPEGPFVPATTTPTSTTR